jgi:tetratricopeptide (TPR) repeat protein
VGSSPDDNAHALYVAARKRMDAHDYEQAVILFEESASASPHFKTLELLGECYHHLGKLRSAIIPLAAATALNLQSRAPALLADVFSRLGEDETALRFARLALERSSNNKLALEVLARSNVR